MYYRIARQKTQNGEILIEFYKASSNSFSKKEEGSSRYHRADAATVREDVQERHPGSKVFLVDSK